MLTAFDSPISTLPLLSSLTHLSYLTSTSPRIREILTVDGGLERLVYIAAACIELAHNSSGRPTGVAAKCTCMEGIDRINNGTGGASSSTGAVSRTCACLLRRPRGPRFKAFSAYSKRAQGALSTTEARVLLMTYTLALQSLVNVGVRGSEHIRTRVVQAGVLALAVRVLRGFLAERARQAAELASGATMANLMSMLSANHASLVMPSPDSEAEATLPPVTRTPTPDATTLVAEEVFASEAADVERLEDEPQEAEADDVEMEAPSAVRARSATIKSGPSPPTDIVNEVVDMEEDDDAMDVDDDASPPESAGESDGETEADTMAISAPPRQMSPVAGLDETPRPPVRQLPNAAFEGSPISPHIHLVTPAPSTSALALAFRFREDDVLLCLQLLAYLSKYPHVRAVFHEPDKAYDCAPFPRNPDGSPAPQPASEPPADPSKNVFSLVEKFTVRPSPNDRTVQRLPSEIQYWAGVIMRNACRKDESRGGIRQCANMLCGAWEKYPREFAKCRRCRKAKCASTPPSLSTRRSADNPFAQIARRIVSRRHGKAVIAIGARHAIPPISTAVNKLKLAPTPVAPILTRQCPRPFTRLPFVMPPPQQQVGAISMTTTMLSPTAYLLDRRNLVPTSSFVIPPCLATLRRRRHKASAVQSSASIPMMTSSSWASMGRQDWKSRMPRTR